MRDETRRPPKPEVKDCRTDCGAGTVSCGGSSSSSNDDQDKESRDWL